MSATSFSPLLTQQSLRSSVKTTELRLLLSVSYICAKDTCPFNCSDFSNVANKANKTANLLMPSTRKISEHPQENLA